MLTLEELKTKLVERFDEVLLCDVLEITTEDLVKAFPEKIEDKYDILADELDDGMEREIPTD
jgi:predicted methyltransferase